jgi:hypothetical protein
MDQLLGRATNSFKGAQSGIGVFGMCAMCAATGNEYEI